MIPSIEAAFLVNGPKQKDIAQECGKNPKTIYFWMSGRVRIPDQKRQSFDRALGQGAGVDWNQYDAEMRAIKREEPPEHISTGQYDGIPAPVDAAPAETQSNDGWGFA